MSFKDPIQLIFDIETPAELELCSVILKSTETIFGI